MFTKTKIFISSVAQDSLHQLRQSMWDILRELGHEPMLFERNFGAWDSHINPVQKCIECVRESDVFLLFISNKAGTFYEKSQRTVTHMELIEACARSKTVLVFVDSTVKAEYFTKAKGLIEEYVEAYKAEMSSFPKASEIVTALRSTQLSSHVDPYVWFFIHDIVGRGIYFEDLNLAVAPDWKVYFSDLLRRGIQLMPFKDAIETNERQLDLYDNFYEMLSNAIPSVNIAGFRNLKAFLESFQRSVTGDVVENDFGFVKEPAGSFGDCSAVTLYEFQKDRMVLMEKTGSATGEDYYLLDNKDSFVALTYSNSDPDDQVFFKESNCTFYFCLRLPKHVMTFHLPCEPEWHADKFMASKDTVIRVIINKNALAFDFARMLIGGM
ncbi:hypothetical protein PAESOLCIP111_05177 [Paenibacillus solanacearum]|uniref:DUF4062 domain-containing protein n=1 Tax=Paenibacillus solanacearum TaxID=2048548 RepID=A0A916K8M3_9BACL|nr:DUF4062 domain-containing protein [Paenibacillus solanacearum]CAG7646504.1 hypothetical protein PAESOLCIP111_05177 [Paenibacillus solanacearum]